MCVCVCICMRVCVSVRVCVCVLVVLTMELHLISSCQPGALTLSSSASYCPGFFVCNYFRTYPGSRINLFFTSMSSLIFNFTCVCLIVLICFTCLFIYFVKFFANSGWSAYPPRNSGITLSDALDFHYCKLVKVNVCSLIKSAGIYHEDFKDICVTDANFLYLWESGKTEYQTTKANKARRSASFERRPSRRYSRRTMQNRGEKMTCSVLWIKTS